MPVTLRGGTPLWINWEKSSKPASFCIGNVSTVWWPIRHMLLAGGSWSIYNYAHFRFYFSLRVPAFFPSGHPLPLRNSSKDPPLPQGPVRARWCFTVVSVSMFCMLACLCLPKQLTTRASTEPWDWLRLLARRKTCYQVPNIYMHTHTRPGISIYLRTKVIHSESPHHKLDPHNWTLTLS